MSSTSNEVTAKVTFSMLRGKVGDRLLDAIQSMGFTEPTEIQAKTLPHLLLGNDLIGVAKEGSGKMLAFLIPTIELLDKLNFAPVNGIGCIILSPTREMILRTCAMLEKMVQYVPLTYARALGGSNKKLEARQLAKGQNIVVATPARLLGHLQRTSEIKYSNLKMLVINTGNYLESAGFDRAVNELIKLLPETRQTVIFSTAITDRVNQLANLVMPGEKVYVTIDSSEDSSESVEDNSELTQGISPHTRTAVSIAQGHTFHEETCMKEQYISTFQVSDEKYVSTYPKVQPASLEVKLPTESNNSCVMIQQRKEQEFHQPQDMVKTQQLRKIPLSYSSLSKPVSNSSASDVYQSQCEKSQGLLQNKLNLMEDCINVALACDNITQQLKKKAQLIIDVTNKSKTISKQTTPCGIMYNQPLPTNQPKQQPINQHQKSIQEKQNKDSCALAFQTVNTGTTISSANLSQVISQKREIVPKSSPKGTMFQVDTPNMKRNHIDDDSSLSEYSKRVCYESGEPSALMQAGQHKDDAIDMVVITEPSTDLSSQKAIMIIERISKEYIKWTFEANDAKVIAFEGHPFFESRDEAIHLRCSNEETVDWLKKTVESLAPLWPGCKLATKKSSELTKYVKCALFASKWKHGIDSLHKFLAGINPHLKINEWVLYDYRETKNGILLDLGIPKTTVLEVVVPNDRLVYYMLGSIYLKFYTANGKLVSNYSDIDRV